MGRLNEQIRYYWLFDHEGTSHTKCLRTSVKECRSIYIFTYMDLKSCHDTYIYINALRNMKLILKLNILPESTVTKLKLKSNVHKRDLLFMITLKVILSFGKTKLYIT